MNTQYYITTLDQITDPQVFRVFHCRHLDATQDGTPILPQDQVILSAVFRDTNAQQAWEAAAVFDKLPDPLRNQPLRPSQITKLQTRGASPGNTTFDVADKLAAIDEGFRFQIL